MNPWVCRFIRAFLNLAVDVSLACSTAGTLLLPNPLSMPGIEPTRSLHGQVPANTREVPSLDAQEAGVFAGITGKFLEVE